MGLHKSRENWLLPLGFVAAAFVIQLGGDDAREWLRYDRVWIGQGELWRLVSGHFTHLGWQHLGLNGASLVLIWYLVGRNLPLNTWLLTSLVIVVSIDAAFWTLNQELYWYVGMSGLLHGLLVAGIAARWPRIDAEAVVLAGLVVLKLGWEQWHGALPGSEVTSGGPVVVDAHLYGAIGGILAVLIARVRGNPATAI